MKVQNLFNVWYVTLNLWQKMISTNTSNQCMKNDIIWKWTLHWKVQSERGLSGRSQEVRYPYYWSQRCPVQAFFILRFSSFHQRQGPCLRSYSWFYRRGLSGHVPRSWTTPELQLTTQHLIATLLITAPMHPAFAPSTWVWACCSWLSNLFLINSFELQNLI